MKLSDCITDYLNHIRHERNLSRNTCEHYTSWLHAYTEWLDANGYQDADLESAFTVQVLRRYQYAKAKTGVRPRTMLSAFHSLRGLGEFLVKNGLIEENPCKKLTMPKKDAAVRLEVTDADVAALFDAAERQVKPRQIALCRAVLAVLAYGGLRREEACCLTLADVNLLDKSLLVKSGKGAKSRKVFINSTGVAAVREWLAVREPDTKHDFLFSIDRARRLHHTGIASMIETLKATAGLRDNDAIKPHGLRHWCATNLLRNGANLRDVQQFLGHSSITVTANYLHSSEEQLRNIGELTALRPQAGETPSTQQQRNDRERPRSRRIPR